MTGYHRDYLKIELMKPPFRVARGDSPLQIMAEAKPEVYPRERFGLRRVLVVIDPSGDGGCQPAARR